MTRSQRARLSAGRLLVTLMAVGGAACRAESQDPPPPAEVLFIGNSLTFANDLPALFARVARDAGDTAVAATMVAFPAYSLLDHLDEGSARRALESRRWTHVVLQQGPSSLPENAALLREWTERFEPLIRRAGAEPVLYMVWPDRTRAADAGRVRASYRDAAAAEHGVLAPAGDAFELALADDPTLPLFQPDGFHPSLEGSWLAAVVLLARVRGIGPLGLAPAIPGSALAPERVRRLQQAAARALVRNPARP